jgi:hypothetical protein
MPPRFRFKRLAPPPELLVDATSGYLVPLLSANPDLHGGPVPWLKLILVRLARTLAVEGASSFAIVSMSADDLIHAIAKVASVLLPDSNAVRDAVTQATEHIGTLSQSEVVAPAVDLTPMRRLFPDESPDPRPPAAPKTPALPVERLEEILRGFSEALRSDRDWRATETPQRAGSEITTEVSEALRRTADMACPNFDSHGSRTMLEEKDQMEGTAIAALANLPRLKMARNHKAFGSFRGAVDKLVSFMEATQGRTLEAVIDKYVNKAVGAGRSFSSPEGCTLCHLVRVHPHLPDAGNRAESWCSIAEILALTAEEAELIRCSRWARQPLTGRMVMRTIPDLPMKQAANSTTSERHGQHTGAGGRSDTQRPRVCDKCKKTLKPDESFQTHNKACSKSSN